MFERYLPNISFNNIILLINSKDIVSSQENIWSSKKVNGEGGTNIVYLSTKAHRVSMKGERRNIYSVHYDWLETQLKLHWEKRYSLTMEQLRHICRTDFEELRAMKRGRFCQ